jgi:hypothetical protein
LNLNFPDPAVLPRVDFSPAAWLSWQRQQSAESLCGPDAGLGRTVAEKQL